MRYQHKQSKLKIIGQFGSQLKPVNGEEEEAGSPRFRSADPPRKKPRRWIPGVATPLWSSACTKEKITSRRSCDQPWETGVSPECGNVSEPRNRPEKSRNSIGLASFLLDEECGQNFSLFKLARKRKNQTTVKKSNSSLGLWPDFGAVVASGSTRAPCGARLKVIPSVTSTARCLCLSCFSNWFVLAMTASGATHIGRNFFLPCFVVRFSLRWKEPTVSVQGLCFSWCHRVASFAPCEPVWPSHFPLDRREIDV